MNSHAVEKFGCNPEVITLEMRHQSMVNYNYLVIDPRSRRAVIVDPAWQMEKIDAALSEYDATLSGILLTHSHPDHIHLSRPLADKYQCPIWMARAEVSYSKYSAPQLREIDETPWRVGDLEINPVFTPGHTPGCMCYRIGDNIFTGDVLFAEGCGMCPDLPAAGVMFRSLRRLKAELGPETRIFPGHSYGRIPGQQFQRVMRENIYLQFDNEQAFTAFRMRPQQSRARMFAFQAPLGQ